MFQILLQDKKWTKFKDMPIDKTGVIIYTNRKLDPKLTWHQREEKSVDISFKTCDTTIFNFTPDNNENKELYTLLENAVEGSVYPGLKSLISDFLKKLIIATGHVDYRQLDKLIAAEICEQPKFNLTMNDTI
jgi:hypothetical protein